MKKNDLVDYKKQDIKALVSSIAKTKTEILDLIMDQKTGKLTNLRLMKNKKRDVAQMKTILKQKELLKVIEQTMETEKVSQGAKTK